MLTGTVPDNVSELCAGNLYAISGFVPTSVSVTWIEPHLRGQLAVSCYVLSDDEECLLVDTGLAVHRDEIASGLLAVMRGPTRRAMIMTRREPDAIINLP